MLEIQALRSRAFRFFGLGSISDSHGCPRRNSSGRFGLPAYDWLPVEGCNSHPEVIQSPSPGDYGEATNGGGSDEFDD
jgi:hypothetical protein